jgi:hypothetical protein
MDAGAVTFELDRDPFAPVRLRLKDGTCIDLPMPFLSFIHWGKQLFAAHAIRVTEGESPSAGLELIPLSDIVRVDRLSAGVCTPCH